MWHIFIVIYLSSHLILNYQMELDEEDKNWNKLNFIWLSDLSKSDIACSTIWNFPVFINADGSKLVIPAVHPSLSKNSKKTFKSNQ
jgi:hypothetical protein